MAVLSDVIERFIKDMMEYENMLELRRNELAQQFNCAPSQINYVLATRFSPEHGYVVESRRGGGGCIRVVRICTDRREALTRLITGKLAGGAISAPDARAVIAGLKENGYIDGKGAALISAAVSDRALPADTAVRDALRANILREVVIALMKEG